MSFIRKIKQRGKIYYAEVENLWIDGKCVQKHIRSLGTDLKHPTSFQIEPLHFSYLAIGLMEGTLTANDVFEMLANMGYRVRKEILEQIGIYYNFGKKTFYIYLFHPKRSKKLDKKSVARSARKSTKHKR